MLQAHTAAFGVADQCVPQVDYAAAKDHVRGVIETIAPVDSQERFEGFGVRVIREYGHFKVSRKPRCRRRLPHHRRGAVVIATGSSPLVPPIPGLDKVPYLKPTRPVRPAREAEHDLLIIGGGPIGMEMAQAHVRLGCKVTVIEGFRALGKDDPEAAALVLDALRAEGVEIAEGAMVSRVGGQAGAIEVETRTAACSEARIC